jgi:hypothetical protein
LKIAANCVLASLNASTYWKVCLGISLAAALLVPQNRSLLSLKINYEGRELIAEFDICTGDPDDYT